jgi:3-hydroxymyristoyl/3-hydroxydecanoyl-(acyl carrier protein) dehydratase
MQLAAFHMLAMDPQDRRSMVPTEIGEMRFLRQCRPGEPITLEARLRVQNQESVAWDARGLDEQGSTIMQLRMLRLHWVSQ